jgi:hypothetical protein
MVAGYVGALRNMDQERAAIGRFVAEVCREGGFDPSEQLVILVGFRSNVGERLAMEIAGPGWLDGQGGARMTGEADRQAAEARWLRSSAAPPAWPYRILGGGGLAVWLEHRSCCCPNDSDHLCGMIDKTRAA